MLHLIAQLLLFFFVGLSNSLPTTERDASYSFGGIFPRARLDYLSVSSTPSSMSDIVTSTGAKFLRTDIDRVVGTAPEGKFR